jgi:hypothetical protein
MLGESGQEMEQSMGGISFYNSIAEKIEPSSNLLRVFRTLDFIYYIGGHNFATYLNVSEAKVSYGQAAPTYSNILNGEGLFDSRYKYEVTGKELTISAVDSLANGRFTSNLGFANYTRP